MAVGTADYTMKNLNEKTNEEIEGFLKKSKEELFNLRFQSATGQLENTKINLSLFGRCASIGNNRFDAGVPAVQTTRLRGHGAQSFEPVS